MRLSRRQLSLAFIAAVAAAFPGSGWAHAVIIKSDPAAGARVHGPRVDFRLQYNSRIDLKRSRLVIDLPDGSHRTLSIRPEGTLDTLAAQANGLSPGSYRLHWQVLSVDGHVTRGDIPFEVEP
jgi:methionine-rich copper-binding protein CopC